MESQRLKLIKILLSYVIEKNRQEENFMELINEIRIYSILIYRLQYVLQSMILQKN